MKMVYVMLRQIRGIKMTIKFKTLAFLLGVFSVAPICGLNAGKPSGATEGACDANWPQNKWWNYKCSQGHADGAGDFIRHCATGKVCPGTFGDEYAIVGLMSQQIVEHGAKLCIYSIQCANKKRYYRSWLEFYEPTGGRKCAWFCEKGYTGTGCAKQVAVLGGESSTTVKEWLGSPEVKSGGERNGNLVHEVNDNRSSLSWGYFSGGQVDLLGTDVNLQAQANVFIGAVGIRDYGVIAAPVRLSCALEGWKNNDSYIKSVYQVPGDKKLLCIEGYTPNSANTDCVYATESMIEVMDINFCSGFDGSKYDANQHTFGKLQESDTCYRYFCKDENMAFTSSTDVTCTECSTGVKGGPSPKNGTCVKCQHGEYYDKINGVCKPADAYSSTDLVYGKGKTKDTNTKLDNQCWTVITPENYRVCVESGGAITSLEME